MNGYEFVKGFLTHTGNDVAPLVEYANYKEQEWLEFKSNILPIENEFKLGENCDDFYWGIAKAIFAMMNSTGGAILIGVTDKGELVEPQKRQQYEEKVIQNFLDQVINRSAWRTGKEDTWTPSLRYKYYVQMNYVVCEEGKYREVPVLIVFVKPTSERIFASRAKGNSTPAHALIIRKEGEANYSCPNFDPNFIVDWKSEPEREGLVERLNVYKENLQKNSDQSQNALLTYKLNKVFLPHFIYDEQHEAGKCYHSAVYESYISVALRDKSGDPLTVADDSADSNETRKLLEILQAHQYVLLKGAPGSGKTTRLRHAVHEAFRDDNSQHAKPVYVNLGDYNNEGKLLELIVRTSGITQNILSQLLASAKVSLVFDGAQASSPLIKELKDMIVTYPDVHVMIGFQTPGGDVGYGLSKIFEKHEYCFCELQPLKKEEAERFLDEAFKWSPEDYKIGVSSANLVDAMIANPGVAKLSENPRFLIFAATLVADQKSLDVITNNRAQIYQEYSKMYCPVGVDVQLLGRIAFGMCLDDREWIYAEEQMFLNREESADFLCRSASQMPLMMTFDERLNRFTFAEAVYRDFFAAEYLHACLEKRDEKNALDDLGKFGKGNNQNASRWLRVLSLLLDLCQEHIGDLINKNADFITTLWEADPLFAIYSPIPDWQLSGYMAKQPLSQDVWHGAICSILLGSQLEAPFGKLENLPFKPDKKKTQPLICDEWVGYLASRHAEGGVRIKRLIDYSKKNLQPCGGMILKYLSKSIDTLKSEMNDECYGWKSMALGDLEWFLDLDNPAETESLVYLAYGTLETHTYLRKGFISMSNDFELFHAHPEKLGIFLWKRLVEMFVIKDDFKKKKKKYRDDKSRLEAATNRSLFEAAARAHQYKFLSVYPVLASVESDAIPPEDSLSDYVVGVWDGLSHMQHDTLKKVLPPRAKVNLIAGGKLKEEITNPDFLREIAPFLTVDACIEIDKILRNDRGQFAYWKSIEEKVCSRLLSNKVDIKKLLVNGVIRLGDLAPEQAEQFFNSASLIDILLCLDVSPIAWAKLPPPKQEVIRNMLRYGVVLKETGGEVKIEPIDGNLLSLLASDEREQVLACHWFVMKPPAGKDSFCEHPALHRRVFAGYDRNEIEKTIGEDAAFVIGKLNWNEDKNNFSLSFPLVGISRDIVSQIRGVDGSEHPESIKGKVKSLEQGGGWTVSSMQEIEGKIVVPKGSQLYDPDIRAGAITLLSGRTWTLTVYDIKEHKEGERAFYAKHRNDSPLVASGRLGEFGIKNVGDIIVAEVSVLVSSYGNFRYRVVDGKGVTISGQ